MIELIEANWLLILLAVLVGFVVAWFLLSGSRKTRITREDTAEEPGNARRNQALIDAPPAVAKDTTAPPEPEHEPEPAPSPAPPPVPTPRAEPAAAAASLGGAGAAVNTAVSQEEAAHAAPEGADDLTRLKGVGPKLATQLNTLGVTSFAQIAGWSEADIDRIDDQLGRFKGRIRRDNWIEQAKLLSEGDTAAYEERFGKL
ncbi:hypothetical protein I5L01_03345 [Erythrobacter sp. YJ-T3-07]|uniref:hypothetical protein n=1 Tax=Erythrobacter sp. YJ-T3-07 TaxID=2793063 RepID=UPI0018D46458|nr:hypothetical protein [Erythrobacter sp. YJ-T3-07]MBH1943260.1 hypothetical protein [Erythrobacter sp. YJ-T3-07]